ncbi:hypothetical protein lmo4a_1411 [Listeria monocytogenes L99]|nr:hypothetical protein lmo4a_1411 [Listeria monocytogenes L99]
MEHIKTAHSYLFNHKTHKVTKEFYKIINSFGE